MNRPIESQYEKKPPAQFGDMHQRMRYLVELIRTYRQVNWKSIPEDVWHAIYDLETEVRNHKAEWPPFGRRPVNLSNHDGREIAVDDETHHTETIDPERYM